MLLKFNIFNSFCLLVHEFVQVFTIYRYIWPLVAIIIVSSVYQYHFFSLLRRSACPLKGPRFFLKLTFLTVVVYLCTSLYRCLQSTDTVDPSLQSQLYLLYTYITFLLLVQRSACWVRSDVLREIMLVTCISAITFEGI